MSMRRCQEAKLRSVGPVLTVSGCGCTAARMAGREAVRVDSAICSDTPSQRGSRAEACSWVLQRVESAYYTPNIGCRVRVFSRM